MRPPSETNELTLARVAHYPLPGTNAPTSVRFSPDSRLVTYLWSAEATLVRQLWAFDVESGEARVLVTPPGEGDSDATVSREEALRRERQRIRGFGVTHYAWARERAVLLVPIQGELSVSDAAGTPLRRLESGGGAIDPKLNPAGDAVAFVRDGELWVLGLSEGEQCRRLTSGASEPGPTGERVITNGLAEFVAQEEMGRPSGFWWSRDGSQIAFVQVDVSAVEPFTIIHQGDETISSEQHRYPFAGSANARVRLGVVPANGGEVRWLPLGDSADIYLARVDWTPDGCVLAQVESRDQQRLDIVRIDVETATAKTLWSEQSDTWINLQDDLRFVEDEARPGEYEILWSSERSGFRHLYRFARDGRMLRQLTSGAWAVDGVVDVHDRWVYFLAGKESPLERRLYRVSLDSGAPQCLTPEPGMHASVLSPSGAYVADLWDSLEHPPSLALRAADGSRVRPIFDNQDDEAARLGLRPPELVMLAAADGTPLHGAIYRPARDATPPPWPVLVSVYGGPHAQLVSRSWPLTVDLRAQYLARQGFLVFKLDNRGSARRGMAFESAIARNMGDREVQDQVAGIQYLATLPEADTSRAGIYGWSYGGYMTLMALLRAPEVFKAGVAGAPVTAWDGYDTHYTERYMGRPDTNAAGYRESSALAHAEDLQGKLLLVHGLIDENVHFRHTARLITALIAAGKPFELLPFPTERHMPRSEGDRVYMEQRLLDHFRNNL
jgi:dipeptidyl-peptidase-4